MSYDFGIKNILKFLRIFFALISRKKAFCDAEQSHLRLEQLFSQNLNRKAFPVKIFGRSAMFWRWLGYWCHLLLTCSYDSRKQINSLLRNYSQLSNLWWMPNSVSIGFGTAMRTRSSRRFKRCPTTHMWVVSPLLRRILVYPNPC